MIVGEDRFDRWMERIMLRLDILDKKIDNKEDKDNSNLRIDGEAVFDNQDLCMLLKMSKRTLQRYRSLGMLKYKQIRKKTYYLETDVHNFIRNFFENADMKERDWDEK